MRIKNGAIETANQYLGTSKDSPALRQRLTRDRRDAEAISHAVKSGTVLHKHTVLHFFSLSFPRFPAALFLSHRGVSLSYAIFLLAISVFFFWPRDHSIYKLSP